MRNYPSPRSSGIPNIRPDRIFNVMNEENAAIPEGAPAVDHLTQSKSHARQAAEELRAAASTKARELKDNATERATAARQYAETHWETARTQARDWHTSSEDYVRDNPTKAVLAALGIGFVLGLVFRR